MISIDHYTKEYDNFLDEDYCKKLIVKYEHLMSVEFDNVKAKSGCRGTCENCTCHRMDINNHAIFNDDVNFIATKIYDHLEVYKRDVDLQPGQWPSNFNFEFLKIKRYTPGVGKFLPHVDANESASKRFMVFIIYLNDDFEGGRTVFNLSNKSVTPKTGKLLMFPPFWPWLHEGELVEKNYKYFLGTYLTFK